MLAIRTMPSNHEIAAAGVVGLDVPNRNSRSTRTSSRRSANIIANRCNRKTSLDRGRETSGASNSSREVSGNNSPKSNRRWCAPVAAIQPRHRSNASITGSSKTSSVAARTSRDDKATHLVPRVARISRRDGGVAFAGRNVRKNRSRESNQPVTDKVASGSGRTRRVSRASTMCRHPARPASARQ